MSKIRHEIEGVPFAQVANALLRDVRLSYKARGLLAMVLSNSAGWQVSQEYLEAMSDQDGTTAIRSALKELSEYGYRVVRREQASDGTWRTVTEWRQSPATDDANQGSGYPAVGSPAVGKPDGRSARRSYRRPMKKTNEEDHKEHMLTADAASVSEADGFAEFWKVYPRSAGKGAARKAFARAVKRASVGEVLAGAKRLADDPNLPAEAFIPHPTTWLNRDGWEDDPLPERDDLPSDVRWERLQEKLRAESATGGVQHGGV